jgi:DNA-binding transcriptional regulator YhcF (GntR family)
MKKSTAKDRARRGIAGAGAAAPRTLNEEAYRRIEELIVTLELEPGSVVSEATLSERIGIGTTPIREALQRLAREHLVQILPRRGVIVTAVDVGQQLQVLETRRELDRLIARAAASRATPAERDEMASLGERMERAAPATRSPRARSPPCTRPRAASGSSTTPPTARPAGPWPSTSTWRAPWPPATPPRPLWPPTASSTTSTTSRAARSSESKVS